MNIKTKIVLIGIASLLSQKSFSDSYFNSMLNLANKGSASAQYNLGVMYENGSHVEQNYEKAYYWYLKAAELGDVKAQFSVGLSFEYGDGVEQDDNQAVNWYEIAGSNGCADAQYYAGYAFEKGEGRKKNFNKALEWYKKAIKQGDSASMEALSRMYTKGLGVKADPIVAKMWLNQAKIYEKKNKQSNKDLCVESDFVKRQRMEAEENNQKSSDTSDYSLQTLKSYVLGYLNTFYGLETYIVHVDEKIEMENDNLFWKNEEVRQYEIKTSNYHVNNKENEPKISIEHATLHGRMVNIGHTFSINIQALDKNGKPIQKAANLHPAMYIEGRLIFRDAKQCENYALRAQQYVAEVFKTFPELTLKNAYANCYTTY